MIPQALPVRFLLNPLADRALAYGKAQAEVLNAEAHARAFREISSWQGYAATPLLSLAGLAGRLGVASLWYKDEGPRFGLGSFKALGGAYGVLRALEGRTGQATVTCASAGNHGRGVAWGAARFGCLAVIFLPRGTHAARVRAIRELGARVEEVAGSYDDAVERAAARAGEEGWVVVSDTAYPGYEVIPRHIMQGYTVMVREALEQLPGGTLPTHVFLQAGVGGLAAAVTAHLWETLGPRRPRVVVVEPAEADCLLESALRGHPTPSRGSLATAMDCLACRNVSSLAWRILERGADAFLTLSDQAAEQTVELLASGTAGDPPVLSRPSGVAGLAGLVAARFEPSLSSPLALAQDSRVLIFGSEGP